MILPGFVPISSRPCSALSRGASATCHCVGIPKRRDRGDGDAGLSGSYEKGSRILGLDLLAGDRNVIPFHAGTVIEADGTVRANGGRVLAVTGLGDSVEAARKAAYAAVDSIDWPEGFCRRDIAAV